MKFFDKESLIDAMDSVYKSDVKGKLYRIMYKLNKNNRIKVKISMGETDWKETGENLTQGSVGGSLISAINLSSSVNEAFKDSKHEVNYGHLEMQPLIFQDDLLKLSTSVEHAQTDIDLIEKRTDSKLLDLHLDKSVYIVIGEGKELKK